MAGSKAHRRGDRGLGRRAVAELPVAVFPPALDGAAGKRAHVWSSPAATAVAPLTPDTATGIAEGAVLRCRAHRSCLAPSSRWRRREHRAPVDVARGHGRDAAQIVYVDPARVRGHLSVAELPVRIVSAANLHADPSIKAHVWLPPATMAVAPWSSEAFTGVDDVVIVVFSS